MLQPSTIKFLKDLKKNNNKPWFEKNRSVYENAKADFAAFIQKVIDQHGKKDTSIKNLVAKDCMFRINRDVRFAKDKSPYNPRLDVLIVETTRGDRPTPEGFSRAAEEERLATAIRETFARGGGVMMPLFALGKTQELLAMFFDFRKRGWMKRDTPIYIGGLGAKLTEVHDKLAHHAPRLRHELQLLDAVAPFVVAGQQANTLPFKPNRVYALSSGMMTEKTLSNSFARGTCSAIRKISSSSSATRTPIHPPEKSATRSPATSCSSAPSSRRSR